MEGEPEVVMLTLSVGVALVVELCDTERVAQWLIEKLATPLPLREPEGEAEAVPRKPSAAAPPVVLGLPVPHPLMDVEGEVETESELVTEPLALGLEVGLTVVQMVAVCEAHRVVVGQVVPLWLRVPEVVPEAVPR
jgi:hypothetical protein